MMFRRRFGQLSSGGEMRGSLALWCDPRGNAIEGHQPGIEVHFNIWRDLSDGIDVLDVGFKFDDPRTIQRLYFYLPAHLEKNSIEDLSKVLNDSKTLSAVFNDTLLCNPIVSATFEAKKEGTGRTVFHVCSINIESDVGVQHILEADGSKGTIILFEDNFFLSMNKLGDYYFRFRIRLKAELANLFSENHMPKDRIFHSAFSKTDIVELRLNERRNFGQVLRRQYPKMISPIIRAVHYVLICEIDTELTRSHADFHKMRRLEPNLWDNYINHIGHAYPEKMVIYHWKSISDAFGGIDDFLALAIFNKTSLNPMIAVAGILLVFGAAGSSIQSLLTSILTYITSSCLSNALVQTLVLILLFLAFLLLYKLIVGGRVATGKNPAGDSAKKRK